ncbi:MAG: phosphotransferase [Planctomycetota bacterium]|nr:phosphotransferase [Planctomycetota bacterium]
MSSPLQAVCAKHFAGKGKPERIGRPHTGKFNETWFFSLADRELVFRMAPPTDAGFLFYEKNMMAQEPAIHAAVRSRTRIPVPEILVYDAACDAVPRPFLVMERLPGEPLTARPDVDENDVFRRVGEHLGELHRSVIGERYGYVGAHKPMEPAATWAAAFAVMWNKMLDDIVACDGYDLKQADSMRRLLERDRAVFDRRVPACLLHMDIWHQNILVDSRGQVTGIVDWDRALYGDPEIEFAVLDYCGVSIPSFWEGYGSQRDDSADARLRGVYYYLYELQKYIVIRALRSKNRRDALRYANAALRIANTIA